MANFPDIHWHDNRSISIAVLIVSMFAPIFHNLYKINIYM